MSGPRLLRPDLRDAARRLNATGRILAEEDPGMYKTAVDGREELADWFRGELSWQADTLEAAQMVRLHKRRADPPCDRGPRLVRDGRPGPLAPALVMVLAALICEQLWRRPRVSLRELMQAIAQVCAAESASGRLPPFRVVPGEATSKQDAQRNRQHLADALKLLSAEGTVTVDADPDRAVLDEDSDLVVTGSRERIAVKFSCLSPALLGLDAMPPGRHADALCAEFLPGQAAEDPAEDPAAMTAGERRLEVLRRLADDPATSPLDAGSPGQAPYLHTPGGRERALALTASLGMGTTVRRDWWEVTDPDGAGSGITFPAGRRTERQAALALLEALPRRPDPSGPVTLAEITDLLHGARSAAPRWAAAWSGNLPALARAAAAELSAVRLLAPDPGQPGQWLPTPGVHLWRARVRQPQPAPRPSSRGTCPAAEHLPLPLADPDSPETAS